MNSSVSFSHFWRISIPNDVLVQDVDGESVLLNLRSGRYFGLDAVGHRMWTSLRDSKTVAEAEEILLGEFNVDGDVLSRDLASLVEQLLEHGLIELHDEPVS